VGLTIAGAAAAQDATEVAIHAYGSSLYGKTDGNDYTVGTHEGRYGNSQLSVNLQASPLTDKLRITGQTTFSQTTDGIVTALDFAFAEWRFSDAVKLRAGRVQQPFGLYTEVFRVGTLRPFAILPQGIYGPVGFTAQGYDGIGLTGRARLGHGWALQYDAYGGGIELTPDAILPQPGDEHDSGNEIVRNSVGGRLVIETPVPGLALGVSGYTGQEEDERHSVLGAQAEYVSGPWSLRSEYGRLVSRSRTHAFYVEGARRFGPWQAAARYDWFDAQSLEAPLPSAALGRHQDAGVGLNYWLHPHLVFKAAYHHVTGNRIARPSGEDLTAALAAHTLKERTDLVVVGAQFSF
jgi:hypothetical protein